MAGKSQPSFDKQFVRDWLEGTDWDKNSPPPELPPEIVAQTRAKYIEAYEQLVGEAFAWKWSIVGSIANRTNNENVDSIDNRTNNKT